MASDGARRGASSEGDGMRHAYTKFDPRAFLESREPGVTPAKVAKPAKVLGSHPLALATLATLAARHPAGATDAELIAPAPWFTRVAPPTEGEPPYQMPCVARRGRVEDRGGVVLHFCAECGAWGSFGYRVNLRSDRLGSWYCAKHRP